MEFNLADLNVGSLNFPQIKANLIAFLTRYPQFSEYDLTNPASSSSLFLDILSANTAYNGFYLQQSLTNSFPATATNRKNLLLMGSLAGVLIRDSVSSRVTATVTNSGTTVPAYSSFSGVSSSGIQVQLYNVSPIPALSTVEVEFVTGSALDQFSNMDLVSQSLVIPYSYDPTTIRMFVNGVEWSFVDVTSNTTGSEIFTVTNGLEGYVVTTNIVGATPIVAADALVIYATKSTGSLVNNITFTATPSGVAVDTVVGTVVGHGSLSAAYLRTYTAYTASCRNRLVTEADYQAGAALFLTERGFEVSQDDVTVTSPSPGYVSVSVTGLSDPTLIADLVQFMQLTCMAGILVSYA